MMYVVRGGGAQLTNRKIERSQQKIRIEKRKGFLDSEERRKREEGREKE